MVKLGVNIDHVATLRQARRGIEPSVLEAAKIVEKSGADGVTIHLREDRRHIQDRDVFDISEHIKLPLNLEMAAEEEIVEIALRVKPFSCTLVPEKREEITTEGGLDIIKNEAKVGRVIERLQAKGIIVSLFIEAEEKQIEMAKKLNAEYIEIHTGSYANNSTNEELERVICGGRIACELGLGLNAGHGLNYENTAAIAKIEGMHELNIGHSIISRAVFVGLDKAIKDMLSIIR